MRPSLAVRVVLTFALILLPAFVHSAPSDPLQLVPEQADVVLQLHRPSELYARVYGAEIVQDAQKLGFVQEQLDSTNARRLEQLMVYFEKELGHKRTELLDLLAGGGVVVAVKFAPDPAPALLVVRARDEKLLAKFVELSRSVVEEELKRQESKTRLERGSHREIETFHLADNFHAARAGDALVIANQRAVLHTAIDLHRDGPKRSIVSSRSLSDARKLLPPNSLGSGWINLADVQKQQGFQDALALPNNVPPLTVLFGGYFDVLRRSPFAALGLTAEKNGFLTTVRLPRGRDGLAAGLEAHVPPAGSPGSLPLLEPKGVLFSTSFHLDLGKFWDERNQLFRKEDVRGLESADETTKIFLAGSQLSKLLTQSGPHHRVVVVHQPKAGYTKQPDAAIPAFAIVISQRDREFGKSLEAVIRGAALLGGGQFGLKLVEEKRGEHQLVGYRFPEDRKQDNDPSNLRFNFSPCFARVGDSFVLCSTLELGREMVDLLDKEAKTAGKPSPAAVRSRFYGNGGAEVLKAFEDVLTTQAFLGLALPVEDARKEVQAVLELVRRLGVLEASAVYEAKSFRYDFRLNLGKK